MKKISLLIIINILVSSLVFFYVNNVEADSTTFYVANTGSDSNNGLSQSTPWKTIGKVNTAMNTGIIQTGDDILFKRGDTFSDTYLNVKVGGTSSDWMIIGAYGNGERPVFNNTGSCAININSPAADGLGNISIQDLILKNTTSTSLCVLAFLTNIVISRVDVLDSGWSGIFVDDTIGLKIENCVVHDCVLSCIVLYGSPSHRLSNTKVLNCTAYNSGPGGDNFCLHVDDFNNDVGSNHLFKNCTSYDSSDEDGFDISSGSNIVIEDCETWGNHDNGIVIGVTVKNLTVQNCYFHHDQYSGIYIGDGENVIIRNNVVYNSIYVPFTFYPTSAGLKNCNVYNNDFLLSSTYSGSGNRVMGVTYNYFENVNIKNNIIVTFHSTNPDRLYRVFSATIPPDNDVTFHSNMWWHGSGSDNNKWWSGSVLMNLLGWQQYYPTDKFDNPEISNAGNGIFLLNSTSPCIDAGTTLTQTNNAGSGTTIVVDDASYFTDGYGVINGDIIFVGNDDNLRIIDINYNTNQIIVNRSINYNINEDVSLSFYSGSDPDIGAYESNENGMNLVITNIQLGTSSPLDTDPLYGWINISCQVTDDIDIQQVKLNVIEPDGTINNVSMDLHGSNIYYHLSNTVFANQGDYYYRIWACNINQESKISGQYNFQMPPNWDINNDGECNILDLVLISNQYNNSGQNGWIREDVDNNGEINVLDFALISTYYDMLW